jgi:hypothetical protein
MRGYRAWITLIYMCGGLIVVLNVCTVLLNYLNYRYHQRPLRDYSDPILLSEPLSHSNLPFQRSRKMTTHLTIPSHYVQLL